MGRNGNDRDRRHSHESDRRGGKSDENEEDVEMGCCEQCGCVGIYLVLFFTTALSCFAMILPHWWKDEEFVIGLWQKCNATEKWSLLNCESMLESDQDYYLNPLRGMMLVVCLFAFISLSTCVCASARRSNIFILLAVTTTISFGFGVAAVGYFTYYRRKLDKFEESFYSFYALACGAISMLVCCVLAGVMATLKNKKLSHRGSRRDRDDD